MLTPTRIASATVITLILATLAFAGVPRTINYQGYLKNTDGTPVTAATSVRFSLYSSNPARGNPLWQETSSVTPSNGIYSIQLGSQSAINAPFDVPYYLGVKVAEDAEMTLQPLSSVPYALRANIADSVPGSSISTGAIIDGSVTSAKIATGAVTNAQISGTISSDKLDLSAVQKKYGKVAVVAKSGGDYDSPLTAMSNVATWCAPGPSETNPCLLKIMPGVYDLGISTLVMQPFVDIEGSGEFATTITSAVSDTLSPPANGVVNSADSSEIRFLTISNTATSGLSVAAIVNTSASPKIINVTLKAEDIGGNYHYGIASNSSSSPNIINTTAMVSGATGYNYGVYSNSSSPKMTNVTANVSGGIRSYGVFNYNVASSMSMNIVTVTASGGSDSNYGVFNGFLSSPTMNSISATASGAGTSDNYGVFNINSSSPTMNDVTSSASGGLSNFGVYNTSTSSPKMNNVTATASLGSGSNYGVHNTTSSPYLSNITATASGGTVNNYGIFNFLSSPKIIHALSSASGGASSCGMYNQNSTLSMSSVTASASGASGSNSGLCNSVTSGTYSITIDRSTFEGSTNSVLNAAGYTLTIGASKLIGPRNALGTYIFSGIYDDAGTLTANTFSGNGSGLSNVTPAAHNHSGTEITTGIVSTAILNVGTATGTVSAGDHNHDAAYQKKYGKVAVAAKSGGDYDSPLTAMNNVSAWCSSPPPSADNPCLLKIMPGVYDIGASSLTMQQYVDIEGSGENSTIIRGITVNETSGIVNGASNSEIRFITIEALGGLGLYAHAIYNSASTNVTNVTASASGGVYSRGIVNDASSPLLTNVKAAGVGTTSGFGVLNLNSSSPTLVNVTATGSGGTGNNYGVLNNASSPVLMNVTATGIGGVTSFGVYNTSASPVMTNVTAKGTGGVSNIGMFNNANTGDYTVIADRCTFEGNSYSIYGYSLVTLRLGASKLIGPQNVMGTKIYSGVYDDAGNLTANSFSGSGAGLTNITAANVTGTVGIANGGTGAANAAAALTNLGAAASGHNHDATYVNVVGDTMTGNLTINNSEPMLILQDSGFDGTRPRIRFLNNLGNFDGDDNIIQGFNFYSLFANVRNNDAQLRVFGKTATANWGKFIQMTHDGTNGIISTDTGDIILKPEVGSTSVTGNLSVSGALSKGSGSFKIDHPLDPRNKYLFHSFVESPDMMNIYNGNVTTDANGFATVVMPPWFGALNREFRYQLTVIGQFAQAIIANEIENDAFRIQSDKPAVKVSWQVTGIRKDAYAEKNRIQVEEDKPAAERGTCLHPEVCE